LLRNVKNSCENFVFNISVFDTALVTMTVNRGEYNFNFYNVIRHTINGSRES